MGVDVPDHTEHSIQAEIWMSSGPVSRRVVFGRNRLCGTRGEGIVIIKDIETLRTQDCKLYVRNFPKTKEFRVHVLNDKAIQIAQKRKMSDEKLKEMGIEKVDNFVRSYKRGWVFANELTISNEDTARVCSIAVQAIKALGLNFGGVDVLATGAGPIVNKLAVCEINTAPSLKGETTLQQYVSAFKEEIY